jgi:hypothetical protein
MKVLECLNENVMIKLSRTLYYWMLAFGLDGLKFIRALRGIPYVFRDYWTLKKQKRRCGYEVDLKFSLPSFDDRFLPGGSASGHYFHQDLLVARKIFEKKPNKHVDIGSRVDGFVAHVASFRDVEIFDIRKIENYVPHISFIQHDFMSPEFSFLNYCDSLSCLHALEHFGLGRYGDDIDIEGHIKGFENLKKMLKNNGILYLSVPIGSSMIRFNGERIFSIKSIMELVGSDFRLQSFSYVDDIGDLHSNVDFDRGSIHRNFGCERGCGIFELQKTIV